MKKTAIVTLIVLSLVCVGMLALHTQRVFDSAGNQTGIQVWDSDALTWAYHHNGHCDTLWTATGTHTIVGSTFMCVTSDGSVWGMSDPDGDNEFTSSGAAPFLSPATGPYTLKQ